MGSLGIWMIILGFGSLLLPLVGIQFFFMSFLDAYQPWAGIGIGVLGIVLNVASRVTGGGDEA